MGKLLFWLLIGLIAYLAYQFVRVSQRRARWTKARQKSGDQQGDEQMRQCAHCAVHLPESEALFSSGRYYCCAEHRDSESGR